MDELHGLIRTFHIACGEADIAYAFMGGVAVMAWGEPRATRDLDTLVAPDEEALDRLADRLKHHGLVVDPRDPETALQDQTKITASDGKGLFHVDMKLARTPAERQQLADAREVPWQGLPVRIVSAEDTIAFKVAFGSAQDLRDARSIIWRMGDRIDRERLLRTAMRLGVADHLEGLWDEAVRIAADAERTSDGPRA